MFKRLFGAKAREAEPIPPPSSASVNKTINAIQNLIDHETTLEKRKALLERRAEGEIEKSKEFLKQKKKSQALQSLKRKKMLEAEILNLDNMIMRVTEQRMMLEGQRSTVEVVSTMHTAALTAKENMKVMKIENVDRVVDDINETNDQMRQLNEVFATPLGAGNDLDEEELLGELEELEAEEFDKELLEPAALHRVPAAPAAAAAAPAAKVPASADELAELSAMAEVPSAKAPKAPPARPQPPAKKTQEELELEALQAEMAAL